MLTEYTDVLFGPVCPLYTVRLYSGEQLVARACNISKDAALRHALKKIRYTR